MNNLKYNLSGLRFGSLVVTMRDSSDPTGSSWVCICDCGVERSAKSVYLRRGVTTSCGCKFKKKQHGMSYSTEYSCWAAMKDRCLNLNSDNATNYGDRGITIFPEWIDSFWAFLDFIGPRPSAQHSVGRINNDGNYEPGNVRWESHKEQNNNTSGNVLVAFNGETMTISQWAEKTGIKAAILYDRLRNGWSPERMLSEGKFENRIRTKFHMKMTPDKVEECFALIRSGVSKKELTSRFNVHASTIQKLRRVVRENRQEEETLKRRSAI